MVVIWQSKVVVEVVCIGGFEFSHDHEYFPSNKVSGSKCLPNAKISAMGFCITSPRLLSSRACRYSWFHLQAWHMAFTFSNRDSGEIFANNYLAYLPCFQCPNELQVQDVYPNVSRPASLQNASWMSYVVFRKASAEAINNQNHGVSTSCFRCFSWHT